MDKTKELEDILKLFNDEIPSAKTFEYYRLVTGVIMKYCQETGDFFRLKDDYWEEDPELATCYFGGFLLPERIEFDDKYPTIEDEDE